MAETDETAPEPRKMYRAERHDIYLGLQVSQELDAAIDAVGEASLMRQSDCLRRLLPEGLKSWRSDPAAQVIEDGAVRTLRGVNITGERHT